jgi:hypothetical protein
MPRTNASIVLNSRDATGGIKQNGALYNSLIFNAVGQNIIQGQVDCVSVSEVNFPYDIPNIQYKVTDYFGLTLFKDVPGSLSILVRLTQGFYSGVELAHAINEDISGTATALAIPLTDIPVFEYNETDHLMYITPPDTPSVPLYWKLFSDYSFWNDPQQRNKLGKDIMSLMGYSQSQGVYDPVNDENPLYLSNSPLPPGVVLPPTAIVGVLSGMSAAPLSFTQYIDICSPQLCKFQYFRDGSTTNLARRSDIICRLYIANNQATQEEEGMRPFVINRQFQNARVMRWTADNAVGTIDINLFDDVGQPLATAWVPRPYQITFNCYETKKEDDMRSMGM